MPKVENSNDVATKLVSHVVFETRQVTAANRRRNFPARIGESQYLAFPGFVFVEECDTQMPFDLEMTSGGDEFLLGEPIEGDSHRNAARARFSTTADGTPGSQSMSICSARSELTVESSICSSRR